MNIQNIKDYYKLLDHEKETELRAIIPNVETKSFHFNNEEELLKLCLELEGKYNLYLGVNERHKNGTTKKDIYKIGIIPLDIDCINKPANDKDIEEANKVLHLILYDLETNGFKKPTVIFSGNGFQILLSIPKIEITKDNIDEIDEKIDEFERRMIEKYSNEYIKLDNVGDMPRIMRIAGTYNLKSKTTSSLICMNYETDEKLRDFILNLEVKKKIILSGISEELREIIKKDKLINELYEGNIGKFKSRSEAELSLICKLVGIGLNKEQIFSVMASCKLGKWQEANIQYREISYRKAIEIICRERLINCSNPKLDDLYLVYKKWLWLEDTKRIDVVLATYLTKYLKGTPIWMIIIGKSGDGKTEQVMALNKCEDFHMEHNLTPRTLVSGNPKYPDLAPELNGKVVIIPDMAQILELPSQDKGELWGQLRDLYDGFAGKSSGMGKRAKYSGLRTTFIMCSTPKIDGQILVHQDLGTRELLYRGEDTVDKTSMMDYAMNNEHYEEQMKKELSDITFNFLNGKKIIERDLNPEEMTTLKEIAMFISYARATAEIDSYSNELRNIVYPEQPTRVVKQLKRLYLALMSLEEGYDPKRAVQILWHLAKSSAFPIRMAIFEHFIRKFITTERTEEYTTSQISNLLKIGKGTAKRELSILWNMGILNKRELEEGNRWQTTDYWQLNKADKFIESYIKFV